MRLFCKHKYKAIAVDYRGTWIVYDCSKCGKLMKGGAPRCNLAIKPRIRGARVDDKKSYHLLHTPVMTESIQRFTCTGCEDEMIYRVTDKTNNYIERVYEDEL